MPMISVIDIETTTHNKRGFAACPHDPNNYVVSLGMLISDGRNKVTYHDWHVSNHPHIDWEMSLKNSILDILDHTTLIVGHNIAFDLLYLRRLFSRTQYNSFIRSKMLWDTQIGEYLLTGQQCKFASLDSLSERYGGTQKNNIIKNYWDAGVSSEDIPKAELLTYMREDVFNTKLVYDGQVDFAMNTKPNMIQLIDLSMEHRKATLEMEANGMYFDQDRAHKLEVELSDQRDRSRKIAKKIMSKFIDSDLESNPDSPIQVSAIIYGGDLTVTRQVNLIDESSGLPITYKSGSKKGMVKTKKEKQKMCIPTPPFWVKKEFDSTSTSDEALKTILERNIFPVQSDVHTLILLIIELRKVSKELNTYISAYSKKHTWEHSSTINCVFNHASTSTGRLSSSKPNMQNIPRKVD